MTRSADPSCREPFGRSRDVTAIARRRSRIAPWAALLILTSVFVARANPPAATPPAPPSAATAAAADTTTLQQRVIAYYFHTNYRCASCRQIEAYSHAALTTAFEKELESGRLVWRRVNIEEKGNEHFVADYQLFTKSLVVVEEAKGQQVRWKNLAKVWELLPDKQKFYGYVQDEVRGYLNETP